jgi:hypothetical protein
MYKTTWKDLPPSIREFIQRTAWSQRPCLAVAQVEHEDRPHIGWLDNRPRAHTVNFLTAPTCTSSSSDDLHQMLRSVARLDLLPPWFFKSSALVAGKSRLFVLRTHEKTGFRLSVGREECPILAASISRGGGMSMKMATDMARWNPTHDGRCVPVQPFDRDAVQTALATLSRYLQSHNVEEGTFTLTNGTYSGSFGFKVIYSMRRSELSKTM